LSSFKIITEPVHEKIKHPPCGYRHAIANAGRTTNK
jgi:hypothetical protein